MEALPELRGVYMKKAPILDLKYLARLEFKKNVGSFSCSLGTVEIQVDHETGRGKLITDASTHKATPVKFMTVTHLKWFMDAFK